VLPTALWFVTGLAAAGPGWLLITNAESRLAEASGTALLAAGLVALVVGAACAARRSSRLLLPAGAAVVLLCVAAPITLAVDGDVSPGSWVFFGGLAAVLAVLATALMRGARAGGG
jgi:hypothetical protein